LQENIPDSVIHLVQPYIDNEEFQPASIAKVSKACTSICQWVRAMHKYHFVAKGVEPKRVKTETTPEPFAIHMHDRSKVWGFTQNNLVFSMKTLTSIYQINCKMNIK